MNTPPAFTKQEAEIVGMDNFALCDLLWQLVMDTFHKQAAADDDPPCNCPESLFAAELPEHWWIAYGVHAFEYDVLAGGIRQFLDNHNGLTNHQTAEALKTIGHPELADAFLNVAKAHAGFTAERFPKDAELEGEEYEQADGELDALILEAGKDFRQIHAKVDLRNSLGTYIRNNLERFAKNE
jgi:hypothetical protein